MNRPPFFNYGNGNRNPVYGGTGYGNHLKSHNVNPHKGDIKPEFNQVMERAIIADSLPLPDQYTSKNKKSPRKN